MDWNYAKSPPPQIDWLDYATNPEHPAAPRPAYSTVITQADAEWLALEAIGEKEANLHSAVDWYCDENYIYGDARHEVWARVHEHWYPLACFLELTS